MSKQKKAIKEHVYKVLQEIEGQQCVIRIRVVSWNDGPPLLEKRRFVYRYNEDGVKELVPGKLMGLRIDDFKYISHCYDEIVDLFKSTPTKENTDGKCNSSVGTKEDTISQGKRDISQASDKSGVDKG